MTFYSFLSCFSRGVVCSITLLQPTTPLLVLNSNSSLGLGIAVDLISWESLAVEFEF